MTIKMVDYSSRVSPYVSDEHRGVGHSSDIADTLRSLKVEIRSCVDGVGPANIQGISLV